MPFCRAFLWILLFSWIFYHLHAFQWSHERQRPVRTLNKNRVTRLQNDDVKWHRLNVYSKQGFVPDQSERPTLSEICPRVWIISWPAVYGYRESLHQAHNLIARLLSETFSIGTQTIGISISPTNLQSPQHIHWRYCVDPLTSHNMRKKYWWVKPSRNTRNKNKPPEVTVNARQL
jgi:hypothetical protein